MQPNSDKAQAHVEVKVEEQAAMAGKDVVELQVEDATIAKLTVGIDSKFAC